MGFRNKNRGYQKLRVWEEAIAYYVRTCEVYHDLPCELRRVASNQIASVDSVHRNIAEGYCRRSINEYLHHLNISLGSLGESVSGLEACRRVAQIADTDYARLNEMTYKLETGLFKLVERLEEKREDGDWIDRLVVKESNAAYLAASSNTPSLQYSSTPVLHHYSTTPILRFSTTPDVQPETLAP